MKYPKARYFLRLEGKKTKKDHLILSLLHGLLKISLRRCLVIKAKIEEKGHEEQIDGMVFK